MDLLRFLTSSLVPCIGGKLSRSWRLIVFLLACTVFDSAAVTPSHAGWSSPAMTPTNLLRNLICMLPNPIIWRLNPEKV
eukprot:754760-Hanusia_phi.AAC.1